MLTFVYDPDRYTTTLYHDKKWVIEFRLNKVTGCCGMVEIWAIQPTKPGAAALEYSPQFQEAFNALLLEIQGSMHVRFFLITFNRRKGATEQLQPDWFYQCVRNHPGRVTGIGWSSNPNTNHNTEIKPYIIRV